MPQNRCPNCMELIVEPVGICKSCGYSGGNLQDKPYELVPGTVLARDYIVGRAIGDGAYGITYIGYDTANDRRVAIKEFFPKSIAYRMMDESDIIAENDRADKIFRAGVERFYDDYSQLRRIKPQEYLIKVYSTFMENDTAYAVMEYLEGQTLEEYINDTGHVFSEGEALQLIRPILKTLDTINGMGVFHEEVCPANIFLTADGSPYVIDFGGARSLTASLIRNAPPSPAESYRAPETYLKDGDVGSWTDVYCAGATLYTLLCGMPPRSASTKKRQFTVKSFSENGVRVSARTERAVFGALSADIDDRYETVGELLKRLNGDAVEPVVERNDGAAYELTSEREYESRSGTPVLVKIGIVAAALVVVALGAFLLKDTLFKDGALFASSDATPAPTFIQQPTPKPTTAPTTAPTATQAPTSAPTEEPTPTPTLEPTVEPTLEPTPTLTPSPTPKPTKKPDSTPKPTPSPTPEESIGRLEPTPSPTLEPTPTPTKKPDPTPTPEIDPTEEPTFPPFLDPDNPDIDD